MNVNLEEEHLARSRSIDDKAQKQWEDTLSAIVRSATERGIDREKLVIVNMDADIGRIYLSVISRDGRNYFHEADRQFYTDAGKLLNFPSFYGFFVQAARGRYEVKLTRAIQRAGSENLEHSFLSSS